MLFLYNAIKSLFYMWKVSKHFSGLIIHMQNNEIRGSTYCSLITHQIFHSHFYLFIRGLKGIHFQSTADVSLYKSKVMLFSVRVSLQSMNTFWSSHEKKNTIPNCHSHQSTYVTKWESSLITEPTVCVGFWKWNGQISALSYLHILNCSNKTPFLPLVSF